MSTLTLDSSHLINDVIHGPAPRVMPKYLVTFNTAVFLILLGSLGVLQTNTNHDTVTELTLVPLGLLHLLQAI